MNARPPSHSRATPLRPTPAAPGPAEDDGSRALARLWSTLMSARVLVALAVLALHLVADQSSRPIPPWVLGVCVAYLALTLLARMMAVQQAPEQPWDVHWRYAVGVDIVFFIGLQWERATDVNYAPLLVLPVLLAAIMGTRLLALGTAALITLLLLGHATWAAGASAWASTAHFVQAGLTGAGLLILAWLTSQLSVRLRREEGLARRNRAEAQVQSLVSRLVLEALPDGVLVVDAAQRVRAANPAARAMLAPDPEALPEQFELQADAAWQPLRELARQTFAGAPVAATPLTLRAGEPAEQRLLARTQHTRDGADAGGEGLCLLFLQDARAIESRVRTEKLAAMGRMSAAVAHEIRNPLAAISQANALLAEELEAPGQQRLAGMVQQNAQRLRQIVDDILDATNAGDAGAAARLPLDETVGRFCQEWSAQHGAGPRLQLSLQAPSAQVRFEAEHLRRLLVNLLDNAAQHASAGAAAIQVLTRRAPAPGDGATLSVWSDGAPLAASVQRQLFEPFSSSHSRSSGLGLFICRELCERHGASIGYERVSRPRAETVADGNQFSIGLRSAVAAAAQPASLTRP